jgi:hypothetical protein
MKDHLSFVTPLVAVWLASLSLGAAGCGVTCTPDSCSNGCCGSDGICYTGQAPGYCGLNGATCGLCPAGCLAQGVAGCTTVGTCCDGLICRSDDTCGQCLGPDGGACASSADCCANLACLAGACTPCGQFGAVCTVDSDCCGDDCDIQPFGGNFCD